MNLRQERTQGVAQSVKHTRFAPIQRIATGTDHLRFRCFTCLVFCCGLPVRADAVDLVPIQPDRRTMAAQVDFDAIMPRLVRGTPAQRAAKGRARRTVPSLPRSKRLCFRA